MHIIVVVIIIINVFFLIYSHVLVIRWQSAGNSRYQQEIKVIYPSTLRVMCAMLISMISGSSMATG